MQAIAALPQQALSVSVMRPLQPLGPVNVIFVSSDGVHFYVHSRIILSESMNMFGAILSAKRDQNSDNRLIALSEPAAIVNVVLHTVYSISCAPYQPDADTLIAAIKALPKYGLSLKQCLSPAMPAYAVVLNIVPRAPLEFYTLAAEHAIHPLAVAISKHLENLEITDISDAQMQRMGGLYYKKLLVMLERRADMVKRLVRAPPEPHPPMPDCSELDQQAMRNAWTLLVSDFACEPFRYTSSQSVMAKVGILPGMMICNGCKDVIGARLQMLQAQLLELDQDYAIE
ncbi:uncharacterized protein PHACADRAFT_164077 [Phanerochaete carnosa HHB-10118-sp]|uniref:BTB domain-containing protein n=1 Tax=Phanerochaete carnosa (strain HHB-10118-sp) TaxID=650164 RepID=K5W4C6_PHACS|nr:uncharacterized protein PHACADRAFT_164077 [Phanerochaete carnosa HHB-10118-sp]EKM53784.1 hypothetical protein PHACADRAFT_164077 [Phanerochaete carnosa HHB-10118-sp]